MTSTSNPSQQEVSLISKCLMPFMVFGSFLLNKFLPRRVKRMIFLSAIYAYIKELDRPSDDLVKKLNEVLHLAHDVNVEAIKLPVFIKHTVWKSLDEPVELEDGFHAENFHLLFRRDVFQQKMDQIVDALIERAPPWVVYGSHRMVVSDMRLMMERLA